MSEKLTKCSNFTLFLPEKLSKYPIVSDISTKNQQNSRIFHDFCAQNARILHNNCAKNIFPIFGGLGHVSPLPDPSPTPMLNDVHLGYCENCLLRSKEFSYTSFAQCLQ